MTASEYLGINDEEKKMTASEYLKSKEVQVTEEEMELVREQEKKSFLTDFAERLGYNAARLGTTFGEYLDSITEDDTIKGEFELYLEEIRKDYEKLEEIESRAIVGGRPSAGKAIGEMATFALPAARLGIAGKGAMSIPTTATTWGATDYAISKALGYSDKESINNAFVAGVFGGGIAGVMRTGSKIAKTADEGFEEMQKQAGGGTPPKVDEFDETPMQKAEEDFKYFSEEEVADLTGKTEQRAREAEFRQEGLEDIDSRTIRSGKETILDKEIKDIENKFNKLDEDPEGYIIEVNQDLFQGIDKLDAYEMLRKNKKLADSLKADIETELYTRMDKIDFIKRGDDRIEVGAKSELYEPKDVDTTKAEQLAMDIQVKRVAKKKAAEEAIATTEGRKLDYQKVVEELMPEVNKLHKAYNDNPNPQTLFDLEEALRKVEPIKQDAGLKRGTLDTVEGFVETGETMSKKDIAAKDASIGIGVKDTIKKGSAEWKAREAKIEEQRAINKQKHEEFLEVNKDKLNRAPENEADKIEYEKLVEQDNKYKETDRVLKEGKSEADIELDRLDKEARDIKKIEQDDIKSSEKYTEETSREIDKIEKDMLEEISSDKFANFMSDIYESPTANNFRKIYNATKKAFDSASRFKTVVVDEVYEATKHLPNKGKKFRQDMHKYLLETDYESISMFKTKQEALQFKNKHQDILRVAQKEINLLSRSMSDTKHMNNIDWRGNGFAIARKVGLSTDKADIIEKLVSIEAMSDNAWKFVQVNRNTDAFKLSMDLMKKRTELSHKLFKGKEYNRIKGYVAEVLTNTDSEFTYKRGAIPPEIQSKVKGDIVKKGDMSHEELVEFAKVHDMGLVLDRMGKPSAARKVADEAYKTGTLGKQKDFGEVMGETISASIRKQNINNHVMNEIGKVLNDKNNGLFNGSGSNFVKLTDKEISILPKQLRGHITSVHKEYKQMAIGNMEAHIKTNNQALVSSQLLIKDLVRGFKENVILKNPVSYVNNFVFNYTIGLQNGISPSKMFKYHKKAVDEYKAMRNLQESMIRLIVEGKEKTPQYKKLVDDIHGLDIYKLYNEGLAFSVVSDITSAPSYSNRMSDKIIKRVMKDTFKLKDETIDGIAKVASEIYLNPNAKSGKFLLDTFTKIDIAGRYGIAMDAVSKGKSYSQAANKANSIFGDLDKLSPMWVQSISEFGAIPFGNWFYRVAGGMGKNIIENPAKAVGIGVALYLAEEQFGKRTESFNPMLTILNSPIDMVGMSPMLHLDSSEEFFLPEVYDKLSTGEADKLIASDSF